IYRGSSNNFNTNSGNKIDENDANDETLNDDDVEIGETYYYKLVSVDEAGNHSGSNTIRVEIDEDEDENGDGTGNATAVVTPVEDDGCEVLGVQITDEDQGGDSTPEEGGAIADEGSVLGATD